MKYLIRVSVLAITFMLLNSFCINTYFVNQHGEELYEHDFVEFPTLYRSFNTEYFQNKVDRIDENFELDYDDYYKSQSDKAAYLMKLNRSKEALSILRDLYQEHPLSYNIVINLGTAYELNGKPDSALFFIKKGMEMNQDSHHGSEWFHEKVLEAKLALEQNPNWLKESRVLDVDWKIPANTPDTMKYYDQLTGILHDIAYQLEERIPFTPTPDPMMANILNEFGDLLAEYSILMAYTCYGIGKDYDTNDSYRMRSKQMKMRKLIYHKEYEMPDVKKYFPEATKFNTGYHHHENIHQNGNAVEQKLSSKSFAYYFVGALALLLVFVLSLKKRGKRNASELEN